MKKSKARSKVKPKVNQKVKPEIYRSFIEQVDLKDICLKKANIEGFLENLPKDFALLNEITDDIKIFNEWPGYFQVSHSFKFKMVSEKDPKVVIASLKFELLLTYFLDKPINKDIFDIFKIIHVPFQSWPYAREIIHSCINRLGLPPPILPLLERP